MRYLGRVNARFRFNLLAEPLKILAQNPSILSVLTHPDPMQLTARPPTIQNQTGTHGTKDRCNHERIVFPGCVHS